MKSIIVGNIAENDLRRIGDEPLSADWLNWVRASHKITDRAFFWAGDDKIVITSTPYDPDWVSDLHDWLGWHHVETVCPQRASDYICDDILADAHLMARLQAFITDEPLVKLISWGSTKGMGRLYAALQNFGNVYAPELMTDDKFELGLYLDSKSGFRALCEPLRQHHRQVRIPSGVVCEEADELFPMVSSTFLNEKRPFVIKSDYRSGGSGVLIYRPQDLDEKSLATIEQEIAAWQGDGDFFPPPYIVEAYIPNDENASSQFGYHALVLPDGGVAFIGIGGFLIENESYRGSVIGDLLDPEHLEEIKEIGQIVGAAIARQGYHGRINLDFILNDKNELYINELNAARRGGSSHVFEVHKTVLARYPTMTNLLTYDHFVLPTSRPLSYQDVRPVFQRFYANPPVTGCLSLPIMVGPLQNQHPHIGYMITGPTYEAVAETRTHLDAALCQQVS